MSVSGFCTFVLDVGVCSCQSSVLSEVDGKTILLYSHSEYKTSLYMCFCISLNCLLVEYKSET